MQGMKNDSFYWLPRLLSLSEKRSLCSMWNATGLLIALGGDLLEIGVFFDG